MVGGQALTRLENELVYEKSGPKPICEALTLILTLMTAENQRLINSKEGRKINMRRSK